MLKEKLIFKYKDINSRISGEKRNKVLIINPYPIGADCPIGIMMENLFGSYSSDDIMQLYTTPCQNIKNSKFHSEQIFLYGPLIKWFLNFMKRIKNKNNITKHKPISFHDNMLRNRGVINSRLKGWISFLLPISVNKKIISKINKFAPTIIYTQGYSFRLLKYTNKISKKISCPILIHTLDDWISTQFENDYLTSIPFRSCNKLLKKILNNDIKHLVASPKMEDYMKEKYGGKYSFVMNCCDFTPYIKIDKNPIMKIVYTGGLMLERYLVLDKIASSIKKLNENEKIFELHIYAPASHIELYNESFNSEIFFHYSVSSKEVNNILMKSDILIHVESFSDNVIGFTKYSLSTKIPEYLASGKPLIYFGPNNVGVGEFLFKNDIGISVENEIDFEKALLSFYEDDDVYYMKGYEGYYKGRKVFDKLIMRKKMTDSLKIRIK